MHLTTRFALSAFARPLYARPVFVLPVSIVLLALSSPAIAQDSTPVAPDASQVPVDTATMGGDTITVGAGAAYLPDYEGSNDYRFSPLPGAIGTVNGFNFILAGNRGSIDLIPNRPGDSIDLQFGPIGVVDFNRSSLSSIDDVRIRALGKRKTAIELGGYVGIGKSGIITSEYDRLSLSVSYRKGVTGAHSAGVLQPTINYFTPLSRKAALGLLVTAERAERGYAAAYYDVDGTQSLASGLPVYRTSGGWKNWSVGAVGTYALTGDLLHGFKAVGGVTYRRMLNDFADSPVVSVAGSRDQWLGVLGLAYTF